MPGHLVMKTWHIQLALVILNTYIAESTLISQNIVWTSYISTPYTVKKSLDFTVKYLATSCLFISRYFYRRLLAKHF